MSVMPGPRIALLAPLAASLGAFSCTLLVHALAINAMVNVVRRQTRARLVGASFWIDVAIVTAVIAIAFTEPSHRRHSPRARPTYNQS